MESDSDVEILNESAEHIDESKWKEITCSFTDSEHFLENPVKLACNKNACLSCVLCLSDAKSNIKCKYCEEIHDLGNSITVNKELNERIKKILETQKKDICDFVKRKLNQKYELVVGKISL